MGRLHDVSIAITDGMMRYPGNPEIRVTPHQRIAEGGSTNVSLLSLGSHTATHVDAPKHLFDGGAGVDELPLERLTGPAVVLAFGDDVRAIGPGELARQHLHGRTRVLFRTRNAMLLQRGAFVPDYTYLTPDGAAWLVDRGVELVGVDYLSVEQFRSGHHGAHRALLAAGVVIVEGLALAGVRPGPCRFTCLPLRIRGLDGAPARAILEEE
jgi:arylformamidase